MAGRLGRQGRQIGKELQAHMGTQGRQARKGELYNTGRQAGRQYKATNGRQVKQIRQES
jgi:hypothetical protein